MGGGVAQELPRLCGEALRETDQAKHRKPELPQFKCPVMNFDTSSASAQLRTTLITARGRKFGREVERAKTAAITAANTARRSFSSPALSGRTTKSWNSEKLVAQSSLSMMEERHREEIGSLKTQLAEMLTHVQKQESRATALEQHVAMIGRGTDQPRCHSQDILKKRVPRSERGTSASKSNSSRVMIVADPRPRWMTPRASVAGSSGRLGQAVGGRLSKAPPPCRLERTDSLPDVCLPAQDSPGQLKTSSSPSSSPRRRSFGRVSSSPWPRTKTKDDAGVQRNASPQMRQSASRLQLSGAAAPRSASRISWSGVPPLVRSSSSTTGTSGCKSPVSAALCGSCSPVSPGAVSFTPQTPLTCLSPQIGSDGSWNFSRSKEQRMPQALPPQFLSFSRVP